MARAPRPPSSTQYEAIVVAAAAQMAGKAPLPDVEAAAAAAGVPGHVAKALFPSAEHLTIAVMEHALVLLVDAVTVATARAAAGDPVAQIRAMMHAVLDWAFDNVDASRLLLSLPALRFAESAMVERYNTAVYELARQFALKAQDEGRLDAGTDIEELLLTLRALVLGLTTLEAIEQTSVWAGGDDPRKALSAAVDGYVDLRFRPAAARG
ncbi:hypothetical protein GI374_12055 [Paracoccus sp. S-4012]|uniref:hypothetical protein n=1 Tax=Paracoccus sp. S-4012 TaxID=2665648 RepID=UPI0012AFD723|nr:hypothetical protein [Paracoccus sp. S-4012]MRX51168.1 hypothetical protein [Paracoccus sp. S-4012]